MQLRAGCTTDYEGRRLVSAAPLFWPPRAQLRTYSPATRCLGLSRDHKSSPTQTEVREVEIIHNEQCSFASLHAHGACGASRCSLIWQLLTSLSGATSTHQHAPPVIAHLSLHLHALTLSLCSQTQHIPSVSVVQAGNPACLSAGFTMRMSHHPCLHREDGHLHHRALNAHWIPSAPTVFMSEKSYLFLALTDSYLLQNDISLIWRRAHLTP